MENMVYIDSFLDRTSLTCRGNTCSSPLFTGPTSIVIDVLLVSKGKAYWNDGNRTPDH